MDESPGARGQGLIKPPDGNIAHFPESPRTCHRILRIAPTSATGTQITSCAVSFGTMDTMNQQRNPVATKPTLARHDKSSSSTSNIPPPPLYGIRQPRPKVPSNEPWLLDARLTSASMTGLSIVSRPIILHTHVGREHEPAAPHLPPVRRRSAVRDVSALWRATVVVAHFL